VDLPGGTGTVTSVSVVTANGFAGSVATATTTPAITLSTTINSPILAGNGTADQRGNYNRIWFNSSTCNSANISNHNYGRCSGWSNGGYFAEGDNIGNSNSNYRQMQRVHGHSSYQQMMGMQDRCFKRMDRGSLLGRLFLRVPEETIPKYNTTMRARSVESPVQHLMGPRSP